MRKNMFFKIYLKYTPIYTVIFVLDLFSIYVFFKLSDFLIAFTQNISEFTNTANGISYYLITLLPFFLYFISLVFDSFKYKLIQIFLFTKPNEFLQVLILKNIMTSDLNINNILDINRKINGFTSAVASIRNPILNILKISVSIYAVAKFNFIVSVIGFGCMLIIFFVGRRFLKYEKRGFDNINTAQSHSIDLLTEMADASYTIHFNSAEDFFIHRFTKSIDYLSKSFQLTGFTGRFRELLFTIFPFILPLMFIYINLNSTNKIGSLTGVYSVFLLFLPVVVSLINTNFKTYKSLKFFTDLKPFIKNKELTVFPERINRINMEHINLTLDGKNILNDVSLEFSSNEKVGIIGKTGSGKSVIAKTLMLNLAPSSGQIKYNGKQVLYGTSAGNLIGYAGSDTFIFSGTLKENILLGLENYDKVFLTKAIKLFSFSFAEDDVLHKNLSGGEKSRIGVLRALIRKPDFLIIDEALSSVSSKLADEIIRFIQPHVKTLIIISHRFSDIKDMERMIMIKDGCVIFDEPKDTAMQNELLQSLFMEQRETK